MDGTAKVAGLHPSSSQPISVNAAQVPLRTANTSSCCRALSQSLNSTRPVVVGVYLYHESLVKLVAAPVHAPPGMLALVVAPVPSIRLTPLFTVIAPWHSSFARPQATGLPHGEPLLM